MGEAYDIDTKYKVILKNELKFERVEGGMFAFVRERQKLHNALRFNAGGMH